MSYKKSFSVNEVRYPDTEVDNKNMFFLAKNIMSSILLLLEKILGESTIESPISEERGNLLLYAIN